MKNYYFFSLLLLTVACKNEPKNPEGDAIESTQITVVDVEKPTVGERIKGTVRVSVDPDGVPIFELYDNALVEATPVKDNLLQVLVYVDLKPEEFNLETLEKGRFLIVAGDTIGKVLQTHGISTGQGEHTFAMLMGYTSKDNIKSESIIENSLAQKIAKNEFDLHNWTGFIKNFDLSAEAFEYKNFETYYNYENSIEDPSPGFRIVLLFDSKKLVGILHSRSLALKDFNTLQLDRGYEVSFLADYPQKQQKEFVRFINTWLEGVD